MTMTEKVYELKEDAGAHILRGEDANGNPIDKVMQAGDKVRSKKPLDRLFLNKWICLDDEEKKRKVASAPLSEPVRPARLNRVATVELEGEEDDDVPVVLKADEKDAKEARQKVKADKAAGKVVNDDSKAELFEEEDEEDADAEEFEHKNVKGEEVTESIRGAVEKDLKVFLHNKHYQIFDADDLETPLSSEPLSKKATTKFVLDYKG